MADLVMVGRFRGAATPYLGQADRLADRLEQGGLEVRRCSPHAGRLRHGAAIAAALLVPPAGVRAVLIDVFSGRAFHFAELATRLARIHRLPVIHVLHGGNLPTFAKRHERRVRRVLARAHRVVAPTAYLAQGLAPLDIPIEIIPNAVDTGEFSFRRRLGTPPRHILWLRAFHRLYRPDDALHLLHRLHRRDPRWRLTMVGPDKDGSLPRCRRLVKTLELDGAVTIVPGALPRDVPGYFARADVFVNTTSVDNTPVSVVEAMSSGVPVVSSRVGGVPYLVDDGTTGLLVEPGDIGAFAAAVERLADDPSLREALRLRARSKAESHDWSAVLPRWRDLIASLG